MNKDAGGTINKEDINKLLEMFPNIKVKEVSSLTNLNITEVFQTLVKELNEDAALKEVSSKHCDEIKEKMKNKNKKAAAGDGEGNEPENKEGETGAGKKSIAK